MNHPSSTAGAGTLSRPVSAPSPTGILSVSTDDPARSSAPTLWDRLAAWLKEWSGDVVIDLPADLCLECERACQNVTQLETSRPCAGRVHIGQCLVCAGSTVEVERIGQRWTCPRHHLHVVANVRPKPYPKACCEQENA